MRVRIPPITPFFFFLAASMGYVEEAGALWDLSKCNDDSRLTFHIAEGKVYAEDLVHFQQVERIVLKVYMYIHEIYTRRGLYITRPLQH